MTQAELELKKLQLEVTRLESKLDRWAGRLVPIITAFIAVFGFWWSVTSFNVQQSEEHTWRKAEFVAKTVSDFDSTPRVQNAKFMLDLLKLGLRGRKIELFPAETDLKRRFVEVTPADISDALASNREAVEAPGERLDKLVAIGDCFDVFLSHLEQFDHYITVGLLTAGDVKLDVIYWIDLLNKDLPPEVKKKLWCYMERFQFTGVRNLSIKYGVLNNPLDKNCN